MAGKIAARTRAKRYRVAPQLEKRPEPKRITKQLAVPPPRPLRIFTRDPSVSPRIGGIATVNIPYEQLERGPAGKRFRCDAGKRVPRALAKGDLDLDDSVLLRSCGVTPSPGSQQFHMQMAYAVCSLTYHVFERALGREVDWVCGERNKGTLRLVVRPFALAHEQNAYYDRDEKGLVFGYFDAVNAPVGHTVPNGVVFTGLSHDILAHETTHALLDALRPAFFTPTHQDVVGFHEGFADLVALFLRFTYPDVVEAAIRESGGSLSRADLLTEIAREFGNAMSSESAAPLRTAVDLVDFAAFDSDAPLPSHHDRKTMLKYHEDMEEHDMGAVLLTAVFEAFVTIFRRKTERYYQIAGLRPDAQGRVHLSTDLIDLLAQEASEIAGRFLDICIRAIDYCPPVDMEMGEYLRALITADQEMVADDKWGYREALIRSFRRRHMFPRNVQFMSEDSVRWRPCKAMRIAALAFDQIKFNGDPGNPLHRDELDRQIAALGDFISTPANARKLGLVLDGRAKKLTDVRPPTIQSIRSARRVAPNGRVVFDTIAEITQSCTAVHDRMPFEFFGGCTIVIDPYGTVRYVVHKSLTSKRRQKRQADAIRKSLSQQEHWITKAGVLRPARAGMIRRVHRKKETLQEESDSTAPARKRATARKTTKSRRTTR